MLNLLRTERAKIGSGCIVALKTGTKAQKYADVDESDESNGY